MMRSLEKVFAPGRSSGKTTLELGAIQALWTPEEVAQMMLSSPVMKPIL
jgi:hypothetical protein